MKQTTKKSTSRLLAGLLAVALTQAVPGHAQAPTSLPVVATVDEMLGKTSGVRYYDQHWVPLPGPAGATGYDVYRRIDSVGLKWQLRRYLSTPQRLVLAQFFTEVVLGVGFEGPSREWYPSGQLREEVTGLSFVFHCA